MKPYLYVFYGQSPYSYFSNNTGNAVAVNVQTYGAATEATWSHDRARYQTSLSFVRAQSYANKFQGPRATRLPLIHHLASHHCRHSEVRSVRVNRTFQRTLTPTEFRMGIGANDTKTFSYPEMLIHKEC